MTAAGGAAARVGAANLASRLTGLARVVAVGAALGTTFAGNTYQTANLVSNVLFELLAAGLLSSVLVPPLVRRAQDGDPEGVERLAGAALGIGLAAMGAVTVVGLALRPWLMRALTLAVEDPGVREREVALGSYLLVAFIPQVVLYAVGSVATAALHARQRFTAAALAPVANNLIVIATMGAFWALSRHARPGLDLSTAQRLVLGMGTTAGVLAMTLVPVVALRRGGFRLRPRWDPGCPDLRRLARDGAWAAVGLAMAQVLVAATLVLANRVEGGVIAYHIAFQAFLLPFALLAHPILTTIYPRLAAAAAKATSKATWDDFARLLAGGSRALLTLVVPVSMVVAAVAGLGAGAFQVGALDEAGARLVGQALAAYSLGLAGYAGLHYLTRALYAAGDTRTPALVLVGVAVAGTALMAAGAGLADGSGRLVAIGLAHSAAVLGGTAVLGAALRRKLAVPWFPWAAAGRSAGLAALAGGVAWAGASAAPGHGRTGAALSLVLGATAGLGAYLTGQRLLARRVGSSGSDWNWDVSDWPESDWPESDWDVSDWGVVTRLWRHR